MTTNPIKELRGAVVLTQAAFADQMGVPFRTLQDLEAGQSTPRDVHINAAKWAVLKTAAHENVKGMHVPEDLVGIASKALESVALHDSCPVCKKPGTKMAERTGGDYSEYVCENCGTFRISGSAEAVWGTKPPIAKFKALAEAQSKLLSKGKFDEIPMVMSYSFK